MKRIVSFCAAIPLVAGSFAFAQADAPADNRKGEVRQPDGTVLREGDTTTIRRTTEMQQRGDVSKDSMQTKRVSKCIGENIYGSDGKKLGDIKDVVLDGNNNHISYAVLSYGGVMGMGDKLFAVPWGALHHKGTDDKTYLDVTSDSLKEAPGFDKSHWPDMADMKFRKSVDTFYHYERPDMTRTGTVDHGTMNDHAVTDRPMTNRDANDQMSKGLYWTRRATEIKGANVTNNEKENLGEIKDLVVDKGGRVHYAVLSFGGVLGIGDKLFAVPMEALTSKADDQKFVLNVPKDTLKNAPGFNENNWPDFADATFRSNVNQFYKTGTHGSAKTE